MQFRCVASGSCIPLAFKCDHEDDCGDNSDEEHCGECVCVWFCTWVRTNSGRSRFYFATFTSGLVFRDEFKMNFLNHVCLSVMTIVKSTTQIELN